MIKVSEYFGGNVKSLSMKADGKDATTGVMAAGEYEFGTSTKEEMRIVSGILEAKLPGEDAYTPYKAGEVFFVEAGNKFQVKCAEDVAYVCLYS